MKSKSLMVPTIYLLLIFSITIGIYFTKETYDNYQSEETEVINYVSGSILSRSIPIISVQSSVISPFSNQEITVKRYFYNNEDDETRKQQSLVLYNNTYMPNTGVDYEYKETFDVLSIYDGTVIDVKEDELLGKTVEIRHNNEVIIVYQGLYNIEVQSGDIVALGQKIATSGTNKLNGNKGNNLHLEIYKNGEVIDPMKCIGQKLGDI